MFESHENAATSGAILCLVFCMKGVRVQHRSNVLHTHHHQHSLTLLLRDQRVYLYPNTMLVTEETEMYPTSCSLWNVRWGQQRMQNFKNVLEGLLVVLWLLCHGLFCGTARKLHTETHATLTSLHLATWFRCSGATRKLHTETHTPLTSSHVAMWFRCSGKPIQNPLCCISPEIAPSWKAVT